MLNAVINLSDSQREALANATNFNVVIGDRAAGKTRLAFLIALDALVRGYHVSYVLPNSIVRDVVSKDFCAWLRSTGVQTTGEIVFTSQEERARRVGRPFAVRILDGAIPTDCTGPCTLWQFVYAPEDANVKRISKVGNAQEAGRG